MSNILKFPDKAPNEQRVRNELREMAGNLETCYGAMDEAIKALGDMESQLKLLEEEYNRKLLQLIEEVGIEGVDVEDFQHATCIGVGAGSREFTLTLESGETFTFKFEGPEFNE